MPLRLLATDEGEVVMDAGEKRIITSGLLRVHTVEVYSRERMTQVCIKYGGIPRAAFDLTAGWDVNRADHQRDVGRKVEEDEREILSCSPPCTTAAKQATT